MITFVKYFLIHLTYLALVVVLAGAGMGLPVPEDIPLIFSGYLCSPTHSPIAIEDANPPMIDTNGDGIPDSPDPHWKHRRVPKMSLMMLAGIIGVLAGDSVVYSIGRRGIDTDTFVARHLRKVLHSKRRETVERHFAARHGNLTVFVGRFMPFFRSIVFVFAGMSKMSYPRFLLIDGLAAAISVPVFVWLGHHFAAEIDTRFQELDHVKHIVIPIVLVLAVGGGVLYLIRRRRAAAEAAALENV